MIDKPVLAKITSVNLAQEADLSADTIVLGFEFHGMPYSRPFASPGFNRQNIAYWRLTCLTVILDMKVPETDSRLLDFEMYRATILGREVYVSFDGHDIKGIGKRPDFMFYPDQFGLWNLPEHD
jgi:hypothetical protein